MKWGGITKETAAINKKLMKMSKDFVTRDAKLICSTESCAPLFFCVDERRTAGSVAIKSWRVHYCSQ